MQLGEAKAVINQLSAMKSLVTTLKVSAMEEAARNDYLEQQLKNEAAQHAQALERIGELETQLASEKVSHSKHAEKLSKAEARAAEAAERLLHVESELDDLRQKLKQESQSSGEEPAQDQLASTLKELNSAKEKVDDLHAQLRASEEAWSFEVAAKEALQCTLRGLEEQLAAATEVCRSVLPSPR